jgi:hypothetical protein
MICYKNYCQCHNIPPSTAIILKKRKTQRDAKENLRSCNRAIGTGETQQINAMWNCEMDLEQKGYEMGKLVKPK